MQSALPPKILSSHLLPLLKPPSPVLVTDAAPVPPHLCHALSDIHRLLTLTASPTTRSAHRRTQKKLEFYIAGAAAWSRADWQLLDTQIDKMVDRELNESEMDESLVADAPPLSGTLLNERPGRQIEELNTDVGGPLPVSSVTEIVDSDGETARLNP